MLYLWHFIKRLLSLMRLKCVKYELLEFPSPREFIGLGAMCRLQYGQTHLVSINRPAVRTGNHVVRTDGQYGRGNLSYTAVRRLVEGYPPDESLGWDETTHITSLLVEVRDSA